MSTNYYLHRDFCKCCGKPKDIIHIGKSSCGWRFLFEKNNELQKYDDLEEFLNTGIIHDEYDNVIPKTTFIKMINEFQENKQRDDDNFVYHDDEEYEFSRFEFC